MTLAFDEIQDDKIFEDLTAEYFRDLKDSPDNNITNVEVKLQEKEVTVVVIFLSKLIYRMT